MRGVASLMLRMVEGEGRREGVSTVETSSELSGETTEAERVASARKQSDFRVLSFIVVEDVFFR